MPCLVVLWGLSEKRRCPRLTGWWPRLKAREILSHYRAISLPSNCQVTAKLLPNHCQITAKSLRSICAVSRKTIPIRGVTGFITMISKWLYAQPSDQSVTASHMRARYSKSPDRNGDCALHSQQQDHSDQGIYCTVRLHGHDLKLV